MYKLTAKSILLIKEIESFRFSIFLLFSYRFKGKKQMNKSYDTRCENSGN